MIQSSQIHERMKVVGSDGGRVGRVDHVTGEEIELAWMDLAGGFRSHLIPLGWVDHVDGETICLTMTCDAAKSAWRSKP